MPRHIIKTQVLELELPSVLTARQLQDTVSRIYYESVIPVIEKCCNGVDSPDTVHRFDSLYIDVGDIPPNDLEKELPARTEARLRELLKVNTENRESNDIVVSAYSNNIKMVPTQISQLELIEHFISTGTLPWWAEETDPAKLEKNLKRTATNSPEDLADIIERAVQDHDKLKRLVYQFSDAALTIITKTMLRQFNATFRELPAGFTKAFLDTGIYVKRSRSEIRLTFWREIFSIITESSREKPDLSGFIEELLTRLSRKLGVDFQAVTKEVVTAAEKGGINSLYLRKILSAKTVGELSGGEAGESAQQDLPYLSKITDGLQREKKTEINTEIQQDLERDIKHLIARIREKLRKLWRGREAESNINNGPPKRTVEKLLKLIEEDIFSYQIKEQRNKPNAGKLLSSLKRHHKKLEAVITELSAIERQASPTEIVDMLRQLDELINEVSAGDTLPDYGEQTAMKSPEGKPIDEPFDTRKARYEEEQALRHVKLLVAALKREARSLSTSKSKKSKGLYERTTKPTEQLSSGGKRIDRSLREYSEAIKSIEQFLSVKKITQAAVSRLINAVQTLAKKESFAKYKIRLERLQKELRAAFRIDRGSKNERKQVKPIKHNISDIGATSPEEASETLKENENEMMEGKMDGTKAANMFTNTASQRNASLSGALHSTSPQNKTGEGWGSGYKVPGNKEISYRNGGAGQAIERPYEIYREKPEDSTDEMYIRNAGLVIFWPFLNHFFESVRLVKKGRFVSPEASERGVHLLQYLADGATETPEHELPLNKVLCGRLLAEPVAREFKITKKEVKEADSLMRAVIKNWPALGKISTDGLRAAFLQRRGVLKPRHGDWLVQVERETHDVLLDKMDWTISVIRLPWLENMIYTEW